MCEEDSLRDKFMFKVKNVEGKKGENVMMEPMSWAISKTELIILP